MKINNALKIFCLGFLLLGGVLIGNPAKAEMPAEELFLYQPSATRTSINNPVWQTITIPEGVENISKIYLYLGTEGSTATLGLSLSSTGEFIDSKTISVNTGSFYSYAWYLFDFSANPIPVTENNIYYIRLTQTGSYMRYHLSDDDPYDGGRLSLASYRDFKMRLYWQPPEPQPVIELATLVVQTIKENTVGMITANILQIITLGLVIFCIMLVLKLLRKFN